VRISGDADVVRERLSGFLSDRKAAPVFAIGPLERLASLGCVRPFRLLAEQRRAHNAAILVPPPSGRSTESAALRSASASKPPYFLMASGNTSVSST
jgi:hypothetical protein